MMGLTPTLVRRKQPVPMVALDKPGWSTAVAHKCCLLIPHAAHNVHPHQAGDLQHTKHVPTGQDPGHDVEGHPVEGGQLTVPGLCVNIHQTNPRCMSDIRDVET